MYLYDTHVHTSEGSRCGKVSATGQVRAFKKRGYAGIIITDHMVKGYSVCPEHLPWDERVRYQLSCYEAAKAEGEACGLDVFFGWEFSTRVDGYRGCDILTYGLGEDFLLAHPDMLDYTLEEYSKVVRQYGGYLAQAHPFRHTLSGKDIPHRLLDGMEVFNSTDDKNQNRLARRYAQSKNLHMQAGSDSHYTYDPAEPCGVLLEKRAESIHDIINAIKAGAQLQTF